MQNNPSVTSTGFNVYFYYTVNAIQQNSQCKTEQEQIQKQKHSECKHLGYQPVPTFFISPLLLFFQLVSPSSGFTLAQSQQPVWFWK